MKRNTAKAVDINTAWRGMARRGEARRGKARQGTFNGATTVTLYDVLRFLGLARRKIIEKTLADIERDEAAAKQRVLDAAARLIDKRGEN